VCVFLCVCVCVCVCVNSRFTGRHTHTLLSLEPRLYSHCTHTVLTLYAHYYTHCACVGESNDETRRSHTHISRVYSLPVYSPKHTHTHTRHTTTTRMHCLGIAHSSSIHPLCILYASSMHPLCRFFFVFIFLTKYLMFNLIIAVVLRYFKLTSTSSSSSSSSSRHLVLFSLCS
jgi:hypothetical protein